MERRWQMMVEDSVVLRNGALAVLGMFSGSIGDGEAEFVSTAGKIIRIENVHVVSPRVIGRANQISLTFAGVAQDLVPPGTVIRSVE
jgi:hypothetical protein